MEVTILSKDSIRIKGKQASVVIDPVKGIKPTQADAVLIFNSSLSHDFTKIEGSRLLIKGAGEYEIGGIKISSTTLDGQLVHQILVDNVELLMLDAAVVEKAKDKARDYHMVLVCANATFDTSSLTSFSPQVVLLYGDKSVDVAKNLGKDGIKATQKYQTTVEKLPQEMEVVILG